MPKIFALRHQLVEQQARLTGDVKNRLSPLQDEVNTRTLLSLLPVRPETQNNGHLWRLTPILSWCFVLPSLCKYDRDVLIVLLDNVNQRQR